MSTAVKARLPILSLGLGAKRCLETDDLWVLAINITDELSRPVVE